MILTLVLTLNSAKATKVGSEDDVLARIGFQKMVQVSEEMTSMDLLDVFEKLMKGNLLSEDRDFRNVLNSLGVQALDYIKSDSGRLAMPLMLSLASGIVIKKRSVSRSGIQFLCRIASAVILAEALLDMKDLSVVLIGNIVKVSEALTPVMISALGLTGALTTASLISPVASLGGLGITWCIRYAGMAMIEAAIAVALTGNLSESFRLHRLFKLLKNIALWMSGLLIAGFTAVLSIQGLMGSSMDSAAFRGLQYTAENFIPVIGGEVSGSMDSLIASTAVIKNAVGISGIILLGSVCLRPVIRLGVFSLSLRLAAAVMEPAGDGCIADSVGQFADIAQMLLVMCIACMLLIVLLIAAVLVAAGRLLG